MKKIKNVLKSKEEKKGIEIPSYVPDLILQSATWLQSKSIRTQGLFRVSANSAVVDNLKKSYDSGNLIKWDDYTEDPHIVAGLLKSYLRELREPILTYDLYESFINVDLDDIEKRTHSMRCLVVLLPLNHLTLLRFLIGFLVEVIKFSDVNLMTAQNLAIVFGPIMLRSKQKNRDIVCDTAKVTRLVETLIIDAEQILNNLPIVDRTLRKVASRADVSRPRSGSVSLARFKESPLSDSRLSIHFIPGMKELQQGLANIPTTARGTSPAILITTQTSTPSCDTCTQEQ
eukprot:TRINITY_DN188_c1_g4_i2.p1 TRINITY_DN188_c1_g4~~TRINITY_DN188_c1_g4_i2.p1  ORF type:complete len:287 (-),score=133.17 TRINITY_DN188_c1_g4_i2:85-945(-)